ncbi:MAG: helix-hairpin-helix domain-containing protein [Oscillospiraceae bacterium]|nr:helix-hairpin-helix domain-containing protein [Oscillospiraceae bacterium]
MKPFLPYNILLAVAVATTGFMVFYNLAFRTSFPVYISYAMPAAPNPAEPVQPDAPAALEDDDPDFYYSGDDVLESVTFPLDINLATQAELMFIPQVGNVMSQRIVQYRDVLGGYTSLEQLREIQGVGDATFERISAYLFVADENE